MKIINESISEKSKIYMYEYFKLQYTPLISEDFEFTEDWIKKSDYKETIEEEKFENIERIELENEMIGNDNEIN